MNYRSPPQKTTSSFTPIQTGLLQRKCASCGQHALAGGECTQCQKQHTALQRKATDRSELSQIPPIVNEVLHSPGQALEPETRAFMESRLDRDFSQVRIHTDSKAAESARAVSATAYTVGQNIAFAAGQYNPSENKGLQLLAHELVHTAQQFNMTASRQSPLQIEATDTPQERQAENVSQHIISGVNPSNFEAHSLTGASTAMMQRQPSLPSPSPLQGQWNLTIDERGRVDVTAVGPADIPVVSQPTIGIRRDPNGSYHILVGGKDKVVTVDQIPQILRSSLGTQSGGASKGKKFRVPTCNQLRIWGKEKVRFMTFDDYKRKQKIFHSGVSSEPWLELTQALFDALLETCMSELLEIEIPPASDKPPLEDAPQRTLPEGTEYA